MGSAVTEFEGAAPGDIRAYDVRTGKLRWSFHTIPHPGEFAADSWPKDAWKTAGGANAWAGMSVDQKRGVVYVPTGSPTPDFNGSDRHGQNLFGNSIIALDATTGKRLWHYQTVHHDLWDRDLSSAPTLATLNKGDQQIDVLVQASKQGVLYALDRDSGKPLFPIEEVAVPASEIPGEQTWPTQPQVTLPEPFVRQTFNVEDLSDINPASHAYVKKIFDEQVEHKEFVYMRPPGLKGTIVFPGFYGGANWGGGAFDPDTGLYYINATEAPHLVHMEAVEVSENNRFGFGQYLYKKSCGSCHGANREGFYPYAPALTGLAERSDKKSAMAIVVNGKGRMMPFANLSDHERNAILDYLFTADSVIDDAAKTTDPGITTPEKNSSRTDYLFAGYNDFVDQRWYPAVKPPWGTLNAIDLNSGKRRWQVTLGEYAELIKEGIPPTGTRNFGGPVVTKGGLIFITASSDEKIRAFDKHSGKLLWEHPLPTGGYATPSIYAIDGKQYIVITCGGGKLGTKAGDSYIAFPLPDNVATTSSTMENRND
ncbi:MAG: PQQ-binding-like beta-propeller repeat protein [Gammaproteobacteria bacterium]|nr:PQQ-binding-like beta-propeller repeat protein [Gammaproteobacteria bacterium]